MPKGIGKKVFLVFLGIFLSLVFLELGLRAAGVCLRAFDAFGAKQARSRPKAEGALRILCLGPCYTIGVGVAPEHSYPATLQRILEERYPQKVFEVINGALRGKNLSHFVDDMDVLAARFRPDIVVFNLNDRMDLYNQNILVSIQDLLSPRDRMRIRLEILLNKSKVYQAVRLFVDTWQKGVPWDGDEGLGPKAATDETDGVYAARIRHFEEELGRVPRSVSGLVRLAHALADQGLFEDAARCMQEALEMDPSDGRQYADLFWYRIALGDYPGALETQKAGVDGATSLVSNAKRYIDHFQKKFGRQEDGSASRADFLFLSDHYALLGDYDLAARLLERHLPFWPHFIEYFDRLDFYKAVLRAGPGGVVAARQNADAGVGAGEAFYRERVKPWNFIALVEDFLASKGMAREISSGDGYRFFEKMMRRNLEEIQKLSRKHHFRFLLENMAIAFDQIMTARRACAELGIPLVDIYEAFQKTSDQKSLFHSRQLLRLSEKGNEAWARAIADSLVDHGLLPGHEKIMAARGWGKFFVSEIGPQEWVVITPDWKWTLTSGRSRLIRYREDLLQERDLSLENPEVVYELMRALQAWRKKMSLPTESQEGRLHWTQEEKRGDRAERHR